MLWCEVRLAVPLPQVEIAAQVLREAAPGGVSIEEPIVPLGPEEGVRIDSRRPAVVACYLPVDDGLGARLDLIDEQLISAGIRARIETRRVDETDWADAWKEHFHVERIGERIVIRPSWRTYEPRDGDVVIDLDPGMAFGTGQHETTRGCLVMLERHLRPGVAVLDLGTGSGILAIAALKLGGSTVWALDLERQAVTVALENASRNGVDDRMQIACGSLGDVWPFAEAPRAVAGVVVANIHARALIELAPLIAAALDGTGPAILSGIIAEREPDVIAAYDSLGFRLDDRIADGDWRTLTLTRPDGRR